MSTLKVDTLKNGSSSAIDFPQNLKIGGNGIIQGYTSSASEPSSPATGDYWWDSANEKLYRYINGEFKQLTVTSPLTLPTATVLHLEDPATNFSSGTWTATVGPDATISGTVTTGTDSNSNSYINFGYFNGSWTVGSISSITLPSDACIISVLEKDSSNDFIMEHSTDANTNYGMYHYSNIGYSYGVNRSGSLAGYNPSNAANTSTESPVDSATKTVWGSNLKTNNSTTNMFYSSKFGDGSNGKRNGVLVTGSAQTHSNTTTVLYIGNRNNGSSLQFVGKLYEVYITAALTDDDFDAAIAYFEDKFNL